MAASLWEAAGRPPWHGGLPSARSPEWADARHGIHVALRALATRTPRGPRALWEAIHGTEMPVGPTWGELVGNCTVDELAAKVTAQIGAGGVAITSWNARWIVRTGTAKAAAKREQILKAIDRKDVVVLQETHWDDSDTARWRTLLPGVQVVSTPARAGPAGGRQG